MEYIKWHVSKAFRTPKYINDADGRLITEANDMRGDYEANAKLICEAVNACIEINPENPQAVAEGIKDVVQVLTWVQEDMDSGRSCVSTRSAVHQVLAKINKENSPLTP